MCGLIFGMHILYLWIRWCQSLCTSMHVVKFLDPKVLFPLFLWVGDRGFEFMCLQMPVFVLKYSLNMFTNSFLLTCIKSFEKDQYVGDAFSLGWAWKNFLCKVLFDWHCQCAMLFPLLCFYGLLSSNCFQFLY